MSEHECFVAFCFIQSMSVRCRLCRRLFFTLNVSTCLKPKRDSKFQGLHNSETTSPFPYCFQCALDRYRKRPKRPKRPGLMDRLWYLGCRGESWAMTQ